MNSSGPRAKCDQVVAEAVSKACEIIVSSRCIVQHSTALSSRFNLQTAELPDVRSILQQTKGALHVPLRLDVFYQHASGRELLERWVLEYRPGGIEQFLCREGSVGDSIVQLRHVCKRIVIWLRTLCCWSRLLPAYYLKNSSQIGFSLYMEDNASNLEGFLMQTQPSSVVTPYGELGWKVFYAAKTEHLRQTQPIPIAQIQRQSSWDTADDVVPQSAPAFLATMQNVQQHQKPQTTIAAAKTYDARVFHHPQAAAKTYDAGTLHHRAHTVVAGPGLPMSKPSHHHRSHTAVASQGQTGASTPPRPALERRRTDVINEHAETGRMSKDDSDKAPERVLSGLSLALMMHDEHRAALHEAPSHYGYAYNGHIPWQKIHPSSTTPTTDEEHDGVKAYPLSTSPNVLSSTPPSGAFLSSSPQTLPRLNPLHSPPFAARPCTLLPPLDMLQSSPFEPEMSVQQSADLRRSLWGPTATATSTTEKNEPKDDDIDEMPFAVDVEPSLSSTAAVSSLQSSAVASFANSLKPRKLQMFGEGSSSRTHVDSLAEQLADLKAFGASIDESVSLKI